MARILLPPAPAARPAAMPTPAIRKAQVGAVELAAVWLVCLAMTLGPVLFLIVAAAGNRGAA